MMIEPGAALAGWEDLGKSRYLVRFEMRTMKDIHALDDGREDEAYFSAVEAVSKIGDSLYKSYVSPWVRLFTNEFTAELVRQQQPLRVQKTLLSSLNPFMAPLAWWAPAVRQYRRPVPEENTFRIQEQAVSNMMIAALDMYRDLRDTWYEFVFKLAYGPFGWGALFPSEAPAKAGAVQEEPFFIPEGDWTAGGRLAAIMRMIAAVSLDARLFDNRSLEIFRRLLSNSAFHDVTPTEIKAIFRRQAALLRRGPERAIDGLQDMLLDEGARRDAVNVLAEVLKAVPEAAGMDGPFGRRIRQVLGLKADDLRLTREAGR
jgi:hypothetical protein